MTQPTASRPPDVEAAPDYFTPGRSVQVGDPARVGRGAPPPPAPGLGLGDLLAFVARITLVHAFVMRRSRRSGRPCGCASRRKRWNRIRLRWPLTFRR